MRDFISSAQGMRPASFDVHHRNLTQAECILAEFSERIVALVRSWWQSGKNNLPSLAGGCIWQTAICCGLMWIVMSLGVDCAYLCSSSCCFTEVPTEAFDASQWLFCTSPFPTTDRNVVCFVRITSLLLLLWLTIYHYQFSCCSQNHIVCLF